MVKRAKFSTPVGSPALDSRPHWNNHAWHNRNLWTFKVCAEISMSQDECEALDDDQTFKDAILSGRIHHFLHCTESRRWVQSFQQCRTQKSLSRHYWQLGAKHKVLMVSCTRSWNAQAAGKRVRRCLLDCHEPSRKRVKNVKAKQTASLVPRLSGHATLTKRRRLGVH